MDSHAHSRAAAVRATSAPASELSSASLGQVQPCLEQMFCHRQGGNRMRRPQPCTERVRSRPVAMSQRNSAYRKFELMRVRLLYLNLVGSLQASDSGRSHEVKGQ